MEQQQRCTAEALEEGVRRGVGEALPGEGGEQRYVSAEDSKI
jgi:hypothetical protein